MFLIPVHFTNYLSILKNSHLSAKKITIRLYAGEKYTKFIYIYIYIWTNGRFW